MSSFNFGKLHLGSRNSKQVEPVSNNNVSQPRVLGRGEAGDIYEIAGTYDGYEIDRAILTEPQFVDYSYDLNWRSDPEARALVEQRYDQLTAWDRDHGPLPPLPAEPKTEPRYTHYLYVAHEEYNRKIERIRQEWFDRYFLPRVTSLDPEDYELFLREKIQQTEDFRVWDQRDLDTAVVAMIGDAERFPDDYYQVSADLEMVPLHGAGSVTLLVPVGVKVSDNNLGHSKVLRSADVTAHDKAYEELRRIVALQRHDQR